MGTSLDTCPRSRAPEKPLPTLAKSSFFFGTTKETLKREGFLSSLRMKFLVLFMISASLALIRPRVEKQSCAKAISQGLHSYHEAQDGDFAAKFKGKEINIPAEIKGRHSRGLFSRAFQKHRDAFVFQVPKPEECTDGKKVVLRMTLTEGFERGTIFVGEQRVKYREIKGKKCDAKTRFYEVDPGAYIRVGVTRDMEGFKANKDDGFLKSAFKRRVDSYTSFDFTLKIEPVEKAAC